MLLGVPRSGLFRLPFRGAVQGAAWGAMQGVEQQRKDRVLSPTFL